MGSLLKEQASTIYMMKIMSAKWDNKYVYNNVDQFQKRSSGPYLKKSSKIT